MVAQAPAGQPATVEARLRLDDPVNSTHVRIEWEHSEEKNVPVQAYNLKAHNEVKAVFYHVADKRTRVCCYPLRLRRRPLFYQSKTLYSLLGSL